MLNATNSSRIRKEPHVDGLQNRAAIALSDLSFSRGKHKSPFVRMTSDQDIIMSTSIGK